MNNLVIPNNPLSQNKSKEYFRFISNYSKQNFKDDTTSDKRFKVYVYCRYSSSEIESLFEDCMVGKDD